jgi:hypothetical protein
VNEITNRRLFSDGGDGALFDAAGQEHVPAAGDRRIVSLVPSLTELLFDLGLGDAVVGRTAFCVHPRGRVRAAVSVGGTKTIDLKKIGALAPTHVLVNIDETPRAVADAIAASGARVIVTHPCHVEDNLALFRLLGGVFRCEAAVEELARRFTEARARLARAVQGRPQRRVLYLIWREPWMTVAPDTYIARMLAEAGWLTQPAVTAARYPVIELGSALLDSVDLVLFASEPFPFKPRHLEAFRQAFPRHAAKAMMIDGEMVSWYGSRAIIGLDYLSGFVAQTERRLADAYP